MVRQRFTGIIALVLMTVILSCSGSEAADPTLDPSPQADGPGNHPRAAAAGIGHASPSHRDSGAYVHAGTDPYAKAHSSSHTNTGPDRHAGDDSRPDSARPNGNAGSRCHSHTCPNRHSRSNSDSLPGNQVQAQFHRLDPLGGFPRYRASFFRVRRYPPAYHRQGLPADLSTVDNPIGRLGIEPCPPAPGKRETIHPQRGVLPA